MVEEDEGGEDLSIRTDPSRGEKLGDGEDASAIRAYVEDYSRELHDRASKAASAARALGVWHRSGLVVGRFVELMREAKRITQERTAGIRAEGPPGRRPKMAYWFAVLEDLAGREAVGEAGERV